MASKVETFTAGEVLAVNVTAIEKELTAVWREAAESGQDGHSAVTRACRWNLVVRTDSMDAFNKVQAVVAEISVALPSRAIVLCLEEPNSPTREISAGISAFCHLVDQGKRQVCTEEVILTAKGPAIDDVPAVVLALMVADLPAALYWPGELGPLLQSKGHAPRLLRNIDRLVVDSTLHGGVSDLAALDARLKVEHQGLLLGDLGWLSLRAWRSLVAHAFDDAPYTQLLKSVDEVQVSYAVSSTTAASESPAAVALFFVGWLSSKLGFAAVPGKLWEGRGEWSLGRPEGGAVKVSIAPQVTDAGVAKPGTLVAVELKAGGAAPGSIRVDLSETGRAATVQRSVDGNKASHTAHLPAESEALLLVATLASAGAQDDDRIMRKALELAARLAPSRGH